MEAEKTFPAEPASVRGPRVWQRRRAGAKIGRALANCIDEGDGDHQSREVKTMAGEEELLSIVVEQHERRTLIRLRGDLDIATAPQLVDVLGRANSEIV